MKDKGRLQVESPFFVYHTKLTQEKEDKVLRSDNKFVFLHHNINTSHMAETEQTYQNQSSIIIRSRYGFNRIEKNAIYSIISKIRKEFIDKPYDSENFSDIKVSIDERQLIDSGIAETKEEAMEGLVSLRHRDITIEREDGSSFNCGFISWVQYFPDKKSFEIVVPSLIIPYLIDLSKRFEDNYSLTVAITLKSKWSQLFYELCCMYKTNRLLGEPYFIEKYRSLRHMLRLDPKKYNRFVDFKRRVVDASQKEIKQAFDNEQSDLWFEYYDYGFNNCTEFIFIIHTRASQISETKEIYTTTCI